MVDGFFIALVMVSAASGGTEFRLASHFHDAMVLQRGNPGSTVAGFAAPNSVVYSTSFANPSASPATADAAGRWTMLLPPMLASKEPTTLTFKNAPTSGAPPTGTITILDVLFGDVFLCRYVRSLSLASESEPQQHVCNARAWCL